MPTTDLSPLDRAIIAILQREGRTTYAQIGASVGVSATAAHERIKKLEARGVITGYHAAIDPALVGAGVTAFIFVSQQAGPRGELEELFASRPWVEECHRVAGEESLLLKVRAESMPALEHLVWEIRALDSVERTKTMIVLGTAFEGRPVEPAGPESPLAG
jgi:Lrp/AsnC family transcriptional regulator, leucine-responsive regulatory protein